MPYAETTDVLARAGVLASAFVDGQPVGPAEIETFLAQTAGVIDAAIGARGFAVPVADPVASAALVSVNADMSLLLALQANWPGATPHDVSESLALVQARVDGYLKAMGDGTLAVLLWLGALAAAAGGAGDTGGAATFWTEDAQVYEWWQRYFDARFNNWVDPWGVPTSERPTFRKGMAL